MRPDALIVGAFDPRRSGPPDFDGALAGFPGATVTLLDGPLSAAAARPAGALAGVDCLVDGHVDNLADLDLPPGPLEARLHALWRREGDDILSALRGEFVILLWDRGAQRGVLVRDQLGGRVVFLHSSGDRLTFATDLRPLLRALPVRPPPDELTVSMWLSGDSYLSGRTLYEGIRRLGPGCLVELGPRSFKEREYWRPRYESPLAGTQDELIGQLRDATGAAVRRAIGDARRPGVLLSGGLDSTMVVAHAARASAETRGYAAVFPRHPDADESVLIKDVAERFSVDMVRAQARRGSVLAGSLEYLRRWESPDLSVTSWFWPLLLQRAAADGTDVLLDGEGGDELFRTRSEAIADAVAARDLRRAWELSSAYPIIGPDAGRRLRLRILAQHGLLPLAPPIPSRGRRTGLMRRSARRAAAAATERRPWRHLTGPRGWAAQAHYIQYANDVRGSAEHLARLARTGGVRERHPLLDLDLVQFTLRLPPEYTFSATATRPAQRLAMDGLLPDSVRLRARKSFFDSLRTESTMGGDLPVLRELLGPGARVRHWVEPAAVDELMAKPPAAGTARGDWGHDVIELAKVESWLRYQEDADLPDRILESGRLQTTECDFAP